MASTYLTHTPNTVGNRNTFTMSVWFKISSNTASMDIMGCGGSSDQSHIQVETDKLTVRHYNGSANDIRLNSVASFRDNNAWYHLVVRMDTTQSTEADRLRIYINGEQITSFNSPTYPSQNYNWDFMDNGVTQYIGRQGHSNSNHWDGLLSHFHWCDGYSYAPTEFGETDATTGEWKIKTSPSVNYGTNGFLILKDGNTITDQSSNSNNWSLGAGTLTKTEDCPSNVFTTMNPLDNYYAGSTFSQGNNTVEHGQSSWTYNTSTIKIPEATKFYCEGKVITMNQNTCGIAPEITTGSGGSDTSLSWGGVSFRGNQGDVQKGGSTQSGTFATYTTNDIIQIACDTVNNKLYFGKNGTWLNSGDPTSGASGTGAVSIDDNKDYFFAFGDNTSGARGKWSINFGNGYFGTTAVSSAGTNASNNGIFEYDVPTGYTALSTKGLNL